MAEFAQGRIEEWAPILDEAKRIGLLSAGEIRQIGADVKQWEYVIQKGTRSLQNLMEYVNFGVEIVRLIEDKREKMQCFEKKDEIEDKITFRINATFGTYQRNFCNQLEYWQNRLAFAVGQKWPTIISKTYQEAIKFLGSKHPFLYEKASNYEYEMNPENIDTARQILQEGARNDDDNLDFYLWIFNLELRHASYLDQKINGEKLKLRQDVPEELTLAYNNSISAAEVAYKHGIQKCWDKYRNCKVKLFTEFFKVITKYPQVQSIRNKILLDSEKNCPEEERYVSIAMVEFERGNLQLGMEHLEKGLTTRITVKMYDLTVQVLFNRLKHHPSYLLYANLHTILNHGLERNTISSESFMIWLEMFSLKPFLEAKIPSFKAQHLSQKELFTKEEHNALLQASGNLYAGDIRIMLEVLKSQLQSKTRDLTEVNKTIQLILHNQRFPKDVMEQRVFTVVLMCTENYMAKYNVDSLGRIREILNPQLKSNPSFVAQFVKFIHLRDGVRGVRQYFSHNGLPASYELVKTYAEIEFKCMDHTLDEDAKCEPFRNMMENACLSYGADRVDVWIDYITFEKLLRNEVIVAQLYHRALQTLKPEHHQELMLGFSQLMIR